MKSMRALLRPLLCSALALGIVAQAGVASAESISVLLFQYSDGSSQGVMEDAVRSQVRELTDFELSLKGGDVTLDDMLFLNECEGVTEPPECLNLITGFLEASDFVHGKVTDEGGETVVVLEWYSANQGGLVERVEERVPAGQLQSEAKRIARKLFAGDMGAISVSANEAGADVLIDGKKVGLTPYQAELPVGQHTVEISKLGYASYSETVNVAEGQSVEINAQLEYTGEGMPTNTTVVEPRDEGPMGLIGWISLGVGGGMLVGGIVTGVMTMTTQDEFDALVGAGATPADLEEAKGLSEDGDVLATTTNILLAGGGALVALGTTLVLIHYLSDDEGSAEVDTEATSALDYDFGFFAGPDGAAATFGVNF